MCEVISREPALCGCLASIFKARFSICEKLPILAGLRFAENQCGVINDDQHNHDRYRNPGRVAVGSVLSIGAFAFNIDDVHQTQQRNTIIKVAREGELADYSTNAFYCLADTFVS